MICIWRTSKTYSGSETGGSIDIAGRALLQKAALDVLDEGLVRADALGVATAVTDAVGEVRGGTFGLFFYGLLVMFIPFLKGPRSKDWRRRRWKW